MAGDGIEWLFLPSEEELARENMAWRSSASYRRMWLNVSRVTEDGGASQRALVIAPVLEKILDAISGASAAMDADGSLSLAKKAKHLRAGMRLMSIGPLWRRVVIDLFRSERVHTYRPGPGRPHDPNLARTVFGHELSSRTC